VCCIIEITMLVVGIMTLAKGKFTFLKNKIVVGPPAYFIGMLLTATIPAAFCLGVVLGLAGLDKHPMMGVLDIAIVGVVLAIVAMISAAYGQSADSIAVTPSPMDATTFNPPIYPPPDPNNPYSAPQSDNPPPPPGGFQR
jgi:hypothetical protein